MLSNIFNACASFMGKLVVGDSTHDAPETRNILLENAAALERAKRLSETPPKEFLGALARVSRLLFLCCNAPLELFAEEKDVLCAATRFSNKATAYAQDDGGADLADIIADANALSSRLLAIVENAPAPVGESGSGNGTSIREQLLILEARDILTALVSKKTRLSQEAQAALTLLHAEADDILAECGKRAANVAAACKFLKKYMKAAHRVVDGLLAVDASDASSFVAAQGVEALHRIAQAFEAEKRRLAVRKRDALSVDLAVLDALLRMDGK